jgi:hypothetical protein
MQATILLLEAAILRGWANTSHLSEILDCLKDEARFDSAQLQGKLDSVYTERNSLAVALAKVTLLHGGKAGRGYDNTEDKNWDPEWRNVVYVEVPGVGQVSWHMGPRDLPRIESLPQYMGTWDGTAYGRDQAWPDNIDAPQQQAEPVANLRGALARYETASTAGETKMAADYLAHAAKAVLAAAPQPQAAVPVGGVKEVIEEMLLCARNCEPDWEGQLRAWAAMLSAAPQPQASNGYTDLDRARIVSSLQSARDRMARVLPKHYGEGFDGDLDTMLDAINWMKRNKLETK